MTGCQMPSDRALSRICTQWTGW